MRQALSLHQQAILQTIPQKKFVYDRTYSISSYILLFFTFSLFGWLWEITFHFFLDKTIVNRGVLMGPWLPIYGSGGLFALIFLRRFGKHPLLLFSSVTVICSALEYTTSWLLEAGYGMKWWDYSACSMNLNGRICLSTSVLFGVSGCILIYILAPALDSLYQRLSQKTRLILCLLLLAFFVLDTLHAIDHPNTGKGITDYPPSVSVVSQSK